jgi:energy-coupling factor transporter ATP-binding protein EcfA2
MAKIREITARGVRGIKEEITLELNGKSLLLHGENGTGKSSLERALRWVLLGEDEPNSDPAHTTEESYRRNVGVPAAYPRVSITFVDGSGVTVTPGNVELSGAAKSIRASVRSGWPFLRRSELLDVLTSRPVDRFKYFETFLGLDQADDVIENLAGAKAANESRKTQLSSRIEAAIQPLVALLRPSEIKPTSITAINELALKHARSLNLIESSDGIDIAAEKVQAAARMTASGEMLRKRSDLESLAMRASQVADRYRQSKALGFNDLFAERNSLLKSVAGANEADLIKHALQHFKQTEGDLCPVCGQKVNWAETKSGLEARAETLSRLMDVSARLDQVVEAIRSRFNEIDALAADVARILQRDGEPLEWYDAYKPQYSTLRNAPWQDRDARTAHIVAAGGDELLAFLLLVAEVTHATALGEVGRLPTPEQVPELKSLAALLGRLVIGGGQFELLEQERGSLNREVHLQTAVLEALRTARQDVARDTLSAIQGIVSKNYFTIHPPGTSEDVTGAPSIQVQRHGQGTAFVRGEFGGKEVKDPKWVYSDGHLDTVGICIFLALRRHRAKNPNDPKIMVLDDIIVSIDLGHARRLIELLKNDFSDHQILILTHNGLFAHWCKSLLPGLLRVEIKEWSLESGPRIGDYKTAEERINAAMVEGTAKEIAVALMSFLDEWAAEARYAFSVAVPAKYNEQYTLTDIWEPLTAKLKKMAKAMNSDLGGTLPLLEKLKDAPAVRNLLAAHENDFAKEFPRSVMVGIAKAALELVHLLYCTECQTLLIPTPNSHNPEVVYCPGRHKQYVANPK